MESFKKYQNLRIVTEEGKIADGDYILSDVTIRIKDGYLNDSVDEEGKPLAAVETHDGNHEEHWKNGVLHCEYEPAVKDVADGVEEWWLEGRKVEAGALKK